MTEIDTVYLAEQRKKKKIETCTPMSEQRLYCAAILCVKMHCHLGAADLRLPLFVRDLHLCEPFSFFFSLPLLGQNSSESQKTLVIPTSYPITTISISYSSSSLPMRSCLFSRIHQTLLFHPYGNQTFFPHSYKLQPLTAASHLPLTDLHALPPP